MKKDYFLGLSEEGFHKIVYTEWGQNHEGLPPIICVHGLSRNRSDFDSLAKYLSELNRHVYCPDVIGRGDSDWLKNPLFYTYEQYIADINTLIARTHAKQIDWIGTSMGGLIGMLMASLPKSPIRTLVLNDIGPQVPMKGLSRLAKYVGKTPVFASLEEAIRYFKSIYADFGHLSEEEWRHLSENSVREVSPGRFETKVDHGVMISPAKSKIAWKVLLNPQKALQGTLFDIDLWHIWRNVTCPVLVLHGERSDILLPETIRKMQETHAKVDVVEVPNTGHAPALRDKVQQDIIYNWLMKHGNLSI